MTFDTTILFAYALPNPSAATPGNSMEIGPWIWVGFIVFIIALLIVDLKLVMREPHKVTTKEAGIYSAIWISLGVAFTGVIALWQGGAAASEYITGYLIELSLSMDNVFLWAVLFTYFKVPSKYQHKVLFWGIFGALVLRAGFIIGGIALLDAIHWVVYIFGVLLLYTAYSIFNSDIAETNPGENPVFRWVHKVILQTEDYREDRFFVKEDGKRLATPLFTVLVIIELSDIIFAVDSIPAILAVTRQQFLIFSSNAFAILGLRSLYFLLADMKDRFVYLNKGLAIILAFVGIKFLISEWWEIPTWLSLVFIVVVLAASIVLSLKSSKNITAGR